MRCCRSSGVYSAQNYFEVDGEIVLIDAPYSVFFDALVPVSHHAHFIGTSVRNGNVVTAVCQANAERLSGELEYAFYLMVGAKKRIRQKKLMRAALLILKLKLPASIFFPDLPSRAQNHTHLTHGSQHHPAR